MTNDSGTNDFGTNDSGTNLTSTNPALGRNEPCPCRSGKKYKRCCGVNAAPKLSAPKNPLAGSPDGSGSEAAGTGANGGVNPFAEGGPLSGMDPQAMMKVSQALQRLPKGQLQRLQALMQKAMNGKDVTAEAKEFERTLPLDFQNMIRSFTPAAMGEMAPTTEETTSAPAEMTEEEARALVEQAAKEGKISQEQAQSLLIDQTQENETASSSVSSPESSPGGSQETPHEANAESKGKLGRFWRSLSGKKESSQ